MSTKLPVSHAAHQCLRRGLAMLELTLALPMMLFVMALIINYGTVAAWKVRENSVARLAVWQTRWPRTGATDPRPSYWWPATATMDSSDQGNVAAMDDPRVDLPVARGPLPAAIVNSELLDPTRGLRAGAAGLTKNYPLLGKLGTYTITACTELIDDKWQYQRMGMVDNWQRRVPVLYQLAQAPASLVNAYVQSVLAIMNAPFLAQLRPLDSDPDFIYYDSLFGWDGPPDFYPRLQHMCTTDRGLTDKAVKNLINRILALPRIMTERFLRLYVNALHAFEAIVHADPAASPQMVVLAESQIPQLQTDIGILRQFLQMLKASGGG